MSDSYRMRAARKPECLEEDLENSERWGLDAGRRPIIYSFIDHGKGVEFILNVIGSST